MSTFNDWTRWKVERRFGLKKVPTHPLMEDWLSYEKLPLSDFEQTYLSLYQHRLEEWGDIWNEADLKSKFIDPVINLVNFDSTEFRYFSESRLSGTVDGEEISGIVDGMIATGYDRSEAPFFCLTEYKQESAPGKHPLGQLLAAMLVAQVQNDNQLPIYGAFIIGRNWFFMILKGDTYVTSNAYVASKNEIQDIYFMLRRLKEIIKNELVLV